MKYISAHPLTRITDELPKGGTVLDVGCGAFDTVRQALDVSAKQFRFIGLEYGEDQTVYGAAPALPADIVASGRFERRACNVERDRFPVDDESVDVVFMSHVIEHLNDTTHCWNEVERVLRPQGVLYIETPGPSSLILKRNSWLHRTSSLPDLPLTLSFFDDPTHVALWPKEKLAKAAEAQGLQIVKTGRRRAFGLAGVLPSLIALGVGMLIPPQSRLRYRLVGAGWWNLVAWSDFLIARKGR